MLNRRAQIDQERVSPEDTPGLPKGMNHALTRDSSERPAEYHDIEDFVRDSNLVPFRINLKGHGYLSGAGSASPTSELDPSSVRHDA
jgi:hypothetical protein